MAVEIPMCGSAVTLNPARVIVKRLGRLVARDRRRKTQLAVKVRRQLGADHSAGGEHGNVGHASDLHGQREQHLDRRPDGDDVACANQDTGPADVFGAAVEPLTSAVRSVANRNADLHGNVPDNAPAALLLIDVINAMDFDGAGPLVRQAVAMAPRIAALKRRARAAKIPAIYINDNFGRWQSDFRAVVEHCLDDGVPGEPIARILRPEDDDYFVLKPKHSAFFQTTLDTLLAYLGARTLILTGIAGNICILFSANDAYMRDYTLVVPA